MIHLLINDTSWRLGNLATIPGGILQKCMLAHAIGDGFPTWEHVDVAANLEWRLALKAKLPLDVGKGISCVAATPPRLNPTILLFDSFEAEGEGG